MVGLRGFNTRAFSTRYSSTGVISDLAPKLSVVSGCQVLCLGYPHMDQLYVYVNVNIRREGKTTCYRGSHDFFPPVAPLP